MTVVSCMVGLGYVDELDCIETWGRSRSKAITKIFGGGRGVLLFPYGFYLFINLFIFADRLNDRVCITWKTHTYTTGRSEVDSLSSWKHSVTQIMTEHTGTCAATLISLCVLVWFTIQMPKSGRFTRCALDGHNAGSGARIKYTSFEAKDSVSLTLYLGNFDNFF